jgi:hypothetical protein
MGMVALHNVPGSWNATGQTGRYKAMPRSQDALFLQLFLGSYFLTHNKLIDAIVYDSHNRVKRAESLISLKVAKIAARAI